MNYIIHFQNDAGKTKRLAFLPITNEELIDDFVGCLERACHFKPEMVCLIHGASNFQYNQIFGDHDFMLRLHEKSTSRILFLHVMMEEAVSESNRIQDLARIRIEKATVQNFWKSLLRNTYELDAPGFIAMTEEPMLVFFRVGQQKSIEDVFYHVIEKPEDSKTAEWVAQYFEELFDQVVENVIARLDARKRDEAIEQFKEEWLIPVKASFTHLLHIASLAHGGHVLMAVLPK